MCWQISIEFDRTTNAKHLHVISSNVIFFTIAFAVAIPRKSYILVQFSLASSSLSRSSKTLATLIPVLALFLYRFPSSSTSSFLYYSVILLFS